MKRISGWGSIKRRNPSACRRLSAVFLAWIENVRRRQSIEQWPSTQTDSMSSLYFQLHQTVAPAQPPYPILYIPNTSGASHALAGRLCKTVVSNSLTQTNIIIFSLPSPADVYLSMWPSAHKGTHGHIPLLERKEKMHPHTKTCRQWQSHY